MTRHALIYVVSGTGGIQVDFENYYGWDGKAIFLEKGQYIKFLSDDFEIEKIEFSEDGVMADKESRVLFKHLVSLGHIDFSSYANFKNGFELGEPIDNTTKIIEAACAQWFLQNPFRATSEEYELIFDVKEIIDAKYDTQLKVSDLMSLVREQRANSPNLVKEKVGLSIAELWRRKRWTECRKAVALTDTNIQEISYTMGYKDPGYFNKMFKSNAGVTPIEFRRHFDYDNRDTFVQDLMELVQLHHKEQHKLSFYADKMHLSVKTLQKNTKTKLGDSLGQLIRKELIESSKKILTEDATVKEAALALGFEEPNHFTSFFKRYTGVNPTSFKSEIYN